MMMEALLWALLNSMVLIPLLSPLDVRFEELPTVALTWLFFGQVVAKRFPRYIGVPNSCVKGTCTV